MDRAAATRALVQSRHETIRGIIALRGGVQSLTRAGASIEALQQAVRKGLETGVIEMPATREELGQLINRWIMAAHTVVTDQAVDTARNANRLEADARSLNRILQISGAGNVIPFPTVKDPPVRGKVRRRKKA